MSDSLTIRTNHVPRDVLYAHELTPSERAELDYLDWAALERGEDSASFFRYKGEIYDLGEFFTTRETYPGRDPHPFAGWDGYQSDSFFSGILVRYVDNFERVIVATYYS